MNRVIVTITDERTITAPDNPGIVRMTNTEVTEVTEVTEIAELPGIYCQTAKRHI